jgi:hypothetical protein
MANTFGKQNKITFDTRELDALAFRMKRFQMNMAGKEAESILDKELKKAVKPWQNAINKGTMYKYLEENKGRLQDPFGNTKIKGKRRFVYGRRVGPKLKGKTNGWLAHFFASPARHIRKVKRVPFYSIFRAENGNVAALAKAGIIKAVETMRMKSFR